MTTAGAGGRMTAAATTLVVTGLGAGVTTTGGVGGLAMGTGAGAGCGGTSANTGRGNGFRTGMGRLMSSNPPRTDQWVNSPRCVTSAVTKGILAVRNSLARLP